MSQPYKIRANDRIFLTGKTGSGKTAAAKSLIWDKLDDCIFYDMTGKEAESLNYPVLTDIDEVREALFPDDVTERVTKFVFAPELPSYDDWEQLCELCYNAANIHLIADELMMVYRDGNSVRPTTDHHLKILTNGRKRGVGLTAATQRPVNVPLESISESEHIFTFLLKLPKDCRRMSKIMGPEAKQATDLDQYAYYYDHDRLDNVNLREPLPL